MAAITGEQVGETIMHEINESYAGTYQDPGGNYDSGYENAHRSALSADRNPINLDINQDPQAERNGQRGRLFQGRRIGGGQWRDILFIPRRQD